MTSEALTYFKLANTYTSAKPEAFSRAASIRLITNFTDTTLQKIVTGVCMEAGIYPTILPVAYKQYHLFLKDGPQNESANITFVFFDVNQYTHSAFAADGAHTDEIIEDISKLCKAQQQPVIVSTFPLPFESAYGNLLHESPLFMQIIEANKKLHKLAHNIPNLYIFDIGKVTHKVGEAHARDFRSMYSVDIPFTNDFFVELAREMLGYIKARLGLTKKCLVLDLDNTLWGGVLGEVGASGIELGPDYPGLAYQSFQRTLLEFYNRGIILAINSRNNQADVDEVFNTNPHMILKLEHFAASRINWNNKAQNIIELAQELNIGTDSMVFIDDDAMNRDLVRTQLPEVIVPEWSLPPEQYVPTLLSLKDFYQLQLTDEDLKKGLMYAEEKARKTIHASVSTIDEYIAALDIKIHIHTNEAALIPRLSQMTLKTNQFNITTKRYTEKEIADFIAQGAKVIAADVSDKFGAYGITILAIVTKAGTKATLDTYLMSCRILGRGVEQTFMDTLIRSLHAEGVTTLEAEFIPTAKNMPAKEFLPSIGFAPVGGTLYSLSISKYLEKLARGKASITVVS